MNKKRRSPKESIEAEDSHKETGFIKFPGRELVKVSLPIPDGAKQALYDQEKIKALVNKYGGKYTDIHTHVLNEAAPSPQDISSFLDSKDAKTMIVASVDENTKELQGYFILRKRKKDFREHLAYKEELRKLDGNVSKNLESKKAYEAHEKQTSQRSKKWYWQALESVGLVSFTRHSDSSNFVFPLPKSLKEERKEGLDIYSRNMAAGRVKEATDVLSQRYNLQTKIIPARGYFLFETQFKKKQKGRLEEIISAVVAIIGFTGVLFLLSTNLTGNVIGDTNNSGLNWAGIVLFVIGLIGSFFWLKKRK